MKEIKSENKIRVLVADDSALMRKLIPYLADGLLALKKADQYKPDVITLDVDMPRMDGLTALKHIVAEYKIPVIIVSSLTGAGAEVTIKALELGAMDFITKPRDALSAHIGDIADELIKKVKAVARVSPARLLLPAAIGISTGGPNALTYILPTLPADMQAGLLIVQHMPAGFTEVFASRLNNISAIEVKEARDGDMVLPGRAIIAPGGRHIKVRRTNLGPVVIVNDSAPVNNHKPSVDVLFGSVASEYGSDSVGIIMTGMGEDGAAGLGQIKAAGGITIAQDEASCIVYGMPKAAVDRGYADRVVSLGACRKLL